jgi:hypothetical protein
MHNNFFYSACALITASFSVFYRERDLLSDDFVEVSIVEESGWLDSSLMLSITMVRIIPGKKESLKQMSKSLSRLKALQNTWY